MQFLHNILIKCIYIYHVRVYVCTIYKIFQYINFCKLLHLYISFVNISMLLYSVTLTYNVFQYINSVVR